MSHCSPLLALHAIQRSQLARSVPLVVLQSTAAAHGAAHAARTAARIPVRMCLAVQGRGEGQLVKGWLASCDRGGESARERTVCGSGR